ncbi:tryptophan dimethylallyltransferase-domain-containing protein [Diplogelasinospora grovesii]|uniref:Tryptophan dimethylallyltransferase-domain-containing protein n=1 Tax=Diplogelasinospora grovesii TaxID=303347 RepID=A0AAN6S0N4_9PEZI|nr:tryptophan dimethylallyltransferase-domain-containing protein [Diplogelasinospora grovesii]
MAEVVKTSLPAAAPPNTSVWKSLSQWLPSRNADCDYWWALTGEHLASMLDAAGYTVPYMGPKPGADGSLKWPSLLGVEGSPMEYSWKWNTPTSDPDVRFTMEAINQFAGSAMDPLNQTATREMLHRIAETVPTIDLTWVNHFFATLYDHDISAYVAEGKKGAHFTTTVVNASEFLPRGLSIKTYFVPRRLGQTEGQIPLALWEESLAKLDPDSKARRVLNEFLATNAEGQHLTPFMLAVDDVVPEKSRLKFYFQTPHTSFASVRTIMTLGGLLSVPEQQLQDLRTLIAAVTGLEEDYPEAAEVPCAPEYDPAAKDNFVELPILLSGYLYYFDIAPGAAVPAIKFYTPVRRYGRDDLSLVKATTAWMERHGRGAYCERYLSMLQGLASHRRLDEGKGLQTYVSCLFKKGRDGVPGELDITSYIGPEAFDPARLRGEEAKGVVSNDQGVSNGTEAIDGHALHELLPREKEVEVTA